MIVKIFLIILFIVLLANKPTYAFLIVSKEERVSGIKFPLWKTPLVMRYYGRDNIMLTSRKFFDAVWEKSLEEQ